MSLAYQIIDAVENDNLTFLKRLLETQGSHLINAKDHVSFLFFFVHWNLLSCIHGCFAS